MEHDNQTHIPPSFIALFMVPSRATPRSPYAEILARYELCEDMANMLAPSISSKMHDQGMSEKEVMQRCLAGLAGEGSMVTEPEAQWVVSRLAELVG